MTIKNAKCNQSVGGQVLLLSLFVGGRQARLLEKYLNHPGKQGFWRILLISSIPKDY